MSLTENGGGLSAADVAAVTGGNGYGFGGGDFGYWILILLIFAFMGNGFGYGYGGGGGMQGDVQRGFDQQSVMSGISGINTALSNAEVSRCNSQANILQAINTGQMAANQNYNTLAMALQNYAFNNSAGIADLKYSIATEACADRTAISDALRDVIASNTANTQAILDKMCQQEMESLRQQNSNLQTQLNLANLAASQNAQTGQLLADNAAQTAALKQALNPTPVPAYVVQNPSCCNYGYSTGCGCGMIA